MRRLVIGFFLLALILSLQISPAISEKEVKIERLDTTVPNPIFIGNAPSQACQVGNLNPGPGPSRDGLHRLRSTS
ncbi:MAG: hypothetical protein GTO51_05315 [Candidatus Latescibacteria bacterium]|nr:hypothetical protein [Candidatus Latescibacterota bacterium]NIO28422.1 hypothetical protein [Candidatus Latescibacterota bacterium]NIO55971.1 hypothetical protein [Candidatus Latescibacterota bacterium]NIT01935.1 hypothetical protein [Candidatus Latescibacterota bacterium]